MDRFEKRLLAGAFLFSVGMVAHYVLGSGQLLDLALFGVAYLIIGYDVLLRAARNIGHGNFLDENFLMCIATLGAFAIGMYPEAAAVMLFFQVGEWFEKLAIGKTRRSISDLMDIQPEYAHVVRDGSIETVDPEDVKVGETIEILPGERIPLDGTVVSGDTSLDTSALTGESMPRDVSVGDSVVSGTINLTTKISVRVSTEYEDSTVARVLELVEDSSSRKAPAEKFITKFARYYTPAVVCAAVLIFAIPSILGYDMAEWLYRALTFLVVSCPCALVISVPLSYFCGIGAASRMGVLIKGANFMEVLSRIDTVVFDKTGTLTKGKFEISKIHSMDGDDEKLVKVAATAESSSNHPISRSIREACSSEIDPSLVSEAEEIAGKGIHAVIGDNDYYVGNHRMMMDRDIDFCDEEVAGTNVHIAKNDEYMGHIVISDILKDDAREAMDSLKSLGIRKTVMLSGDSSAICEKIGESLGMDSVRSELLPGDKISELEKVMKECPVKRAVAFVGDGINDAPSLARADVGIAMGGLGSDAAIESADVVIMNDAPSKIASCIRLSKKVNRIVWENIIFALAVKFGIMIATLAGSGDMWLAVFGDVGVTVIAVLNAMRCLGRADDTASSASS